MEGSKRVQLSYAIADFDAEDEVVFDVATGTGLESRWSEGSESTKAADLDDGTKIWMLSQLSPSPEDRDGWTPPFLVSHAVRDALARDGECTIHTGFAPDEPLSLTRTKLDALSEETQEAVAKWKGAILCASSDAGDELVIANAATPQLLALRTNDVCTSTWLSGVLGGADKKAPKPRKKAARKGKRRGSAEVLGAADASVAERVKAAKALGKTKSTKAIEALAAHLTEADPTVGAEVRNQFCSVFWALERGAEPYDVLPVATRIVSSSPAQEIPDASAMDFDPVSGALSTSVTLLQNDSREEVTSFLRDLAWQSLRGRASAVARMVLAGRGDAEAVERVSHMLADGAMNTSAASALLRLPTDIAIERAKAQLEPLEPAARLKAVQTLFNAVERPPVEIDHSAWFALLKSELEAAGPSHLGDRFEMWVGANLARLGPPSEELALLCAREFRVWRDHDLANALAAFPKEALTARVVRQALAMSNSSIDVSPLLAVVDDEVIVQALDAEMEEPEWACSLDACLSLASRKSTTLRPALEEMARRCEPYEPEEARTIRSAL